MAAAETLVERTSCHRPFLIWSGFLITSRRLLTRITTVTTTADPNLLWCAHLPKRARLARELLKSLSRKTSATHKSCQDPLRCRYWSTIKILERERMVQGDWCDQRCICTHACTAVGWLIIPCGAQPALICVIRGVRGSFRLEKEDKYWTISPSNSTCTINPIQTFCNSKLSDHPAQQSFPTSSSSSSPGPTSK